MMSTITLELMFLVAGILFVLSLKSWRFGLKGLLVFLPFAGIISLRAGQSISSILAKDLVFVIPSYISFFLLHRGLLVRARVPALYVAAMVMLATLVGLQAFNPNIPNPVVALIGIKTWLLYLPLTFLAAAAIRSKEDVLRLLRLLVIVSIVPFSVAFLQRVGVEVFGPEATMAAFYGASFDNENYQLFSGFKEFGGDLGGTLYRINATFSANGQYGIYALTMVSVSLALSMIETDNRWKRVAQIMVLVSAAGSFLSGSRGATVFVPMAILPALLLSGSMIALLVWSVILSATYVVLLSLTGIDLTAMLDFVFNYSFYNLQDFGANQFMQTFLDYPLGAGTGMSTGGARYAFAEADLAYQSIFFFEVYYAKIVAELSFIGLLPVIILMLMPLFQSIRAALSAPSGEVRRYAAAMSGFFLVIAIGSYKSWPLDVDPDNVLFWVLTGTMYKFLFLGREKQGAAAMGRRGKHDILPAPAIAAEQASSAS